MNHKLSAKDSASLKSPTQSEFLACVNESIDSTSFVWMPTEQHKSAGELFKQALNVPST